MSFIILQGLQLQSKDKMEVRFLRFPSAELRCQRRSNLEPMWIFEVYKGSSNQWCTDVGARRTGASGLEDLHNAAMLLGGSDREESPPVSPSKQPRTRRSQRQVGRPQRIDL